jgi:hypothetical protein
MKIKVGNKTYDCKINNRVIYNIEEDFGKPIFKIMADAESLNLTMQETGKIIWHTIKDELNWEEFIEEMQLNQYEPANVVVGQQLAKAFETGSKKK